MNVSATESMRMRTDYHIKRGKKKAFQKASINLKKETQLEMPYTK